MARPGAALGLVVAPAVLSKLELFPNQGTAYLSARQRQLEALLEERETPKSLRKNHRRKHVSPRQKLISR